MATPVFDKATGSAPRQELKPRLDTGRKLLVIDHDFVPDLPVEPERHEAETLNGTVQKRHVTRIAPYKGTHLASNFRCSFPPMPYSFRTGAHHHPLKELLLGIHIRHRQRSIRCSVEPGLIFSNWKLLPA